MKKIIIGILGILICGGLIIAKIQYEHYTEHYFSKSDDEKWTLYVAKDNKDLWEGYLIYEGNTSGNIGNIKIDGYVDDEKRKYTITPESYIDDYKKKVRKTRKKTSYYSIVIWSVDIPDISLKIQYEEEGREKETKVDLKVKGKR